MKHKIVLASAGSGKTYSLSNRVLEIALNGGAPERLIALTFTKKAAGEFSSAIFQKLAKAASSQAELDELNAELGSQHSFAHVNEVLNDFIEALPNLNFGTLDSFFTKVVRSFSLELGLLDSNFKLLEGAEAVEVKSEVLEGLLFKETLSEKERKQILQGFKEANFGKEGVKVEGLFLDFIDQWFSLYLDSLSLKNEVKFQVSKHQSWTSQREVFIGAWEQIMERQELTHKSIIKAFKGFGEMLEAYVPGSPLFKSGTFFDQLCSIARGETDEMIFYKKSIQFEPREVAIIEAILKTIALEEIKIKILCSEALWKLLGKYNDRYAQEARSKGKLSFEDIKHFISQWGDTEESRVQKEHIDYRLDAKYDHWLLDEFQDTSRAQWKGLSPLVQEVIMHQSEERSLFIVGDEKQAIYSWRGGDYRLFKEIAERYQIDLHGMNHSWRSQKPVLDLVNLTLGNKTILNNLFHQDAVSEWRWNDHYSAEKLKRKSSFSSVEIIEEDKVQAVVDQVREIQPIQRGLSCAVLLRSNTEVKTYANALREAGFEAAEEGAVTPALDNPVGLAVLDLLKWLERPSDLFAKRHLEFTPLMKGEKLQDAHWKRWTAYSSQHGYAQLVSLLFEQIEGVSEFGSSRFNVILSEMKRWEAKGETLTALIDHLENFSVSLADSPTVIQVMTIHKSKGLGFDVVFLPEIPTKTVEDLSRYHFHYDENEFHLTPVKWISSLFKDLEEKKDRWIAGQTYEAICLLYVAMTRAKRGVYIYLDPKKATKSDYDSNLRDLFLNVMEEQGEEELFTLGDSNWYLEEGIKIQPEKLLSEAEIDRSIVKLERKVRRQASSSSKLFVEDRTQQQKGIALHQQLSRISWVEHSAEFTEHCPTFASEELSYFTSKAVLPFFIKKNEADSCYCEQKIEFAEGNEWYSVMIDRLNLRQNDSGEIHAELIDYKLNFSPDQSPEKIQKVREQLDVYRNAVKALFPEVNEIEAFIFSVSAKKVLKF